MANRWDDPSVYPRVTLNGFEIVPVSQGGFGRTTTTAQIAALAQLQAAPVSSVFGRIGAVTLQSADVAAALGYTPLQSVATATTSQLGVVKIDGTTITIVNGVISATTGGTGTITGVTASTGLTGGGTTGTVTLSVSYGTTAGTAAQGNDSRITGALQAANNLSDVTAATARTNLGLGTAATLASSAVAQTANNLSDLANASTARTNLGLGTAATLASSAVAQTANNLSDLASASTSRTNLGLGTAATLASSAVVQVSNNLSDVTAATARTNLGISTVGNTGAYTDLTGRPSGSATLSFGMGALVAAGTVYVDVPYAATITTLKYNVGTAGGSFTVAVQIAGVNVTSLSAVAVSSSSDNTATATGANTLTAGQRVGFVFSSVTGSPTDAVLTLTWTH